MLKFESLLKRFWITEFTKNNGICGLCGNRGIVDTRRNVFTEGGTECGVRAYCLCPMGRTKKKEDPHNRNLLINSRG